MKFKTAFQLDYTSLLIPLMLLLEGRICYFFSLLLAALIHECGHLLAARLLRIPIASLHVSVLGAQLKLGDPLLSYKREWLLCAAGPFSSVVFALLLFVLKHVAPFLPLPNMLPEISVGLGIVNLLPIGWLDGGRMLRTTCYQLLSATAARMIVRVTSFLCFLALWMTSVYLILRMGRSLSLFVFSFSLFIRFFLSEAE